MLSGGRPHNKTILSVLPDRETFQAAAELIEDVCGNMESEGTGILFSLELTDVSGLKPHPD